MAKYHFNPATGEAGVCQAEIACPFGLPLDGHFDSLREAAVAAEDYLEKQAGGSFGNGMVESFEDFTARREAQAVLAARKESKKEDELTTPTAPVEQYRALMPSSMSHLGDYAHEMGLDLQETWYFAGTLYDKPTPTPIEYKQLILEGIKKHVDEAFEKTWEIDKTLNKSNYFANPKLRHRSSGTTLETYSTYENSDLITRVDERGKASFEVFDQEDGESSYSSNVNGWQSSIGNWMTEFKAYQDHLYLRVLWGNEHKRRTARYEAIGKRVQTS